MRASARNPTASRAHGSHIWAFGPSVYWPLLDFGALDAQVSIADLQAHERLVAYRKTVIDAVQDADTAIANFSAQDSSGCRILPSHDRQRARGQSGAATL